MVREEDRSRKERGEGYGDNKNKVTGKRTRHKIRRGKSECDNEIG